MKNSIRTLSAVLVFASTYVLCAQAEENFTITTYYPSPHGVYRTLRLVPCNDYPTTGLGEGLLVYRSTDNAPAYYNNSGTWVVLASKTDITRIENMATAANNKAVAALTAATTANSSAETAYNEAQDALQYVQNKACPNCSASCKCSCPQCPDCNECVIRIKYLSDPTTKTELSCPANYTLITGGVQCGTNYAINMTQRSGSSWEGNCKWTDEPDPKHPLAPLQSFLKILCCRK